MLERLRGIFIYVVAFLLPLAGAILVVVRFAEGQREEAARIAAAALLGTCVYAIVLAR